MADLTSRMGRPSSSDCTGGSSPVRTGCFFGGSSWKMVVCLRFRLGAPDVNDAVICCRCVSVCHGGDGFIDLALVKIYFLRPGKMHF